MSNDKWGNPVYVPTNYATAFGVLGAGTSDVATPGRSQGYVGTSATTGVAIRATTYTPLGGAGVQCSFKSTSANDSSSGTGAQQVTINYLDSSFNTHSETITLNGTTAVNTVGTNYAYIESMQVSQVGSGGGNVGTIEIFTTTGGGGTVWGSIAAGDNQTFWAHHYVPSGYTCYILGMTCGGTVAAGQTNLNHFGNPSSSNIPELQIGVTIVHVAGGTWDHDYEIPIAVTGPDLILLVEKPISSTASTAVAGFEWVQF